MGLRALHGRSLLAAAVFVGAIFLLGLQLLNPSPVVVSVDGTETEVGELSGFFTYRDAVLLIVASTLAGASASYLLITGRPTDDDATAGQPAVRAPRTPTTDGAGPAADPAGEAGRSDALLDRRKEEWEQVASELARNEREIYEHVLEEDGVIEQREIVDRTDISKATVSRTLDRLESKQLVERKRRGMGNVVVLQ